VRASTPSNAAEIVFPDRKELRGRVEKIRLELKRRTEGRLAEIRAQVRQAALGLTAASPERRLARLTSESRLNRERLNNAVRLRLNGAEARKAEAGRALTDAVNRRLEKAETTLIRIRERLEAINPLGVLQRGYAMVTDLEDRVLTGAQQARDAAEIRIRFANGSVEASVRKEEVPEHE
jgi:exodeoxyribonuclease VII large subunit